jgi:hypothetical protein
MIEAIINLFSVKKEKTQVEQDYEKINALFACRTIDHRAELINQLRADLHDDINFLSKKIEKIKHTNI